MNRDDLRAFAGRDWAAVARAKREHQAQVFARGGSAATIAAARALFDHKRALDPAWPSVRDRELDLAHHVALKAALTRASRRFDGDRRR